MEYKPKIFIGSSTESLNLARGLRLGLSHDYFPVLWTEGVFKASSFAITDLTSIAKNFDAAVFVFSPDDLVETRNKEYYAVRDNVIFECGLFIGALGLQRTFFVVPRGEKELHLPSDLTGVQPLEYIHQNGVPAQQVMGNAIAELIEAKDRILSSPKF